MFSSECFCLRPLLFNGIEVWRVWWQEEHGMSGLLNGFKCIASFMEGRIIHDQHGMFWKFWQQVLFKPCRKNICIDIDLKQPNSQQGFANQCADRVCSPSCVPVLYAVTSFADRRIAMRAWHIVGKAAFIDINKRTAFLPMMPNNRLEDTPCGGARLGMRQRFFYSSRAAF